MEKENGLIKLINMVDVNLLNQGDGYINFWKNANKIEGRSFKNCFGIKNFMFPLDVFLNKVDPYIFSDCETITFYKRDENGRKISEIKIPPTLFVDDDNKLNTDVVKKFDFSYFNKIFPFNEKLYTDFSKEEVEGFFYLALCMGCFTNKTSTYTDLHGNQQKFKVNEKACDCLKVIYNNCLKNNLNRHEILDKYSNLLNPSTKVMELNKYPPLEFYNFIIEKSNNFSNFKTFTDNFYKYKNNYDLIDFIFKFNEINNIKKLNNLSWNDSFYTGLVKLNKSKDDVYNLYDLILKNKYPFTQKEYEELIPVVWKQQHNKVKSHILSKELNGSTADAKKRVELLKDEIFQQLKRSIKNTEFTYEMLDKKNLMNAYIGKYKVDCCSYITSSFYGQIIAKRTMYDQDFQNLVVKDQTGNIVGKGTINIDQKKGEIIINEFDIANKYRGTSKINSRSSIFDTFLLGIYDFVDQYNKENRVKINQVNVGAGNNKLLDELETYKKVNFDSSKKAKIKFIEPPTCFQDAAYDQYVLYKRSERRIKKQTPIIEK